MRGLPEAKQVGIFIDHIDIELLAQIVKIAIAGILDGVVQVNRTVTTGNPAMEHPVIYSGGSGAGGGPDGRLYVGRGGHGCAEPSGHGLFAPADLEPFHGGLDLGQFRSADLASVRGADAGLRRGLATPGGFSL